MTRPFLDSNILLYLLSGEPRKADRAHELAAEGGVISVQVLNEFAHVALRKFKAPWPVIHEHLTAFRALFDVMPLTIESHELGISLSRTARFSLFDGQIIASALIAGCDTLYSEDLQDGQVIEDRLTIRNPFL